MHHRFPAVDGPEQARTSGLQEESNHSAHRVAEHTAVCSASKRMSPPPWTSKLCCMQQWHAWKLQVFQRSHCCGSKVLHDVLLCWGSLAGALIWEVDAEAVERRAQHCCLRQIRRLSKAALHS